MKLLLSLAALAVTCSGLAQGTMEAILGYSSSVSGFVTATAGWTFQPVATLTATELGCFTKIFSDNPAVNSIQVGLWTSGGFPLASNTVTRSSVLVDQSRYESITPVVLSAGQTYNLGVYFAGGSLGLDVAGAVAGGAISQSASVSYRGTALAAFGFGFPAEQPGPNGSIYVGPNFLYQGGVPEPSSLVLLSFGGLFLAARRGRRRS